MEEETKPSIKQQKPIQTSENPSFPGFPMKRITLEDIQKTTFVIYHKNCFDGTGSAYSLWRKFGGKNNKRIVNYVPIDHHKITGPTNDHWTSLLKTLKDQYVIFVDICPDGKRLSDIYDTVKGLLVIDHHISVIKDLHDHCVFQTHSILSKDNTMSAAILTWKFCFPTQEPPLFLKYIQDGDLWTHKYGITSRTFLSGLGQKCTYDYADIVNFEMYEDIELVLVLVKAGELIIEEKDDKMKKLAKTAITIPLTYGKWNIKMCYCDDFIFTLFF